MYDIYITDESNPLQNTKVGEIKGPKLKCALPIVLSDEFLRSRNHRSVLSGPAVNPDTGKEEITVFISHSSMLI